MTSTAIEITAQQRRELEILRVIPDVIEAITWPVERLRAERERLLRDLLRTAKRQSPWHRRRLAHVDPDTVTEERLATIPVMTKAELMEHFDESVTDRRLSRRLVEDYIATHRAGSGTDLSPELLGLYRVVVTSGSSGRRGIFVSTWQEIVRLGVLYARFGLRREFQMPAEVFGGRRVFVTFPRTPATVAPFSGISGNLALPATLPIDRMVSALNEAQPAVLSALASIWPRLVAEARAGRLRIAPKRLLSASEPLYPEVRRAVELMWGVPLDNGYGTGEGACAESCGRGEGLHLAEDACIFELLDTRGRPARPGEPAAKLYVTNLRNTVQPLIRYQIDDEFVLLDGPCPCGSELRRIADVAGRHSDAFTYPDGVIVHPFAFNSPLEREEHVLLYQVRQTPAGARVLVRAEGPVDLAQLRVRIEEQVQQAGLPHPEIEILIVDEIERMESGKIHRHVPLPSGVLTAPWGAPPSRASAPPHQAA